MMTKCAEAVQSRVILVVDDDFNVRSCMGRSLRRAGYEVLEAGSGEAATLAWSQHASEIEMLVTDVMMPGINGLELAQNLSHEKPGLKVLLVSGYQADELTELFDVVNPYPLLGKPFLTQALIDAVRSLLTLQAELK